MAIANETIDERPVSSVYTAGRLFYLVNNTVYYSQVAEGNNRSSLSKCYSKNDPTAEVASDILATDGGTVPVNSASGGIAIRESSNGILIFFSNGVWELAGPESGFTATEFSLRKVTDAGCVSAQSIVQVDGNYLYWGYNKVHSISTNQFSVLEEESITDLTIETFYSDITLVGKKFSTGFYNSKTNSVEWMYNTHTSEVATNLLYSHNKGLTLNLKTGGWFPLDFNAKLVESTVDEQGLVSGVDLSAIRDDGVFYISLAQQTIATTFTVCANTGKRDDEDFQDFGTDFPTAYLETGYESLAKPSNSKSAPYVFTHFNQTEENWVADGSGGFEHDKQSGCQLRAQWDWNNTSANGRFATPQQAYRFRRINVPTTAEPFDSGETVISTKNKVLGRGKALSLRFEQEAGKDFQLLGYTIQWSIKGRM